MWISVKGRQKKSKKKIFKSWYGTFKKRKLKLFSVFVVIMRKTKTPPNEKFLFTKVWRYELASRNQ